MKKLNKGQKTTLVIVGVICLVIALKATVFFGGGMHRLYSTFDEKDVMDTRMMGKKSMVTPIGMSQETLGDDGAMERSVAKQGSLSLLVDDAEDAAGEIKVVAQSLGGYVVSASVYEVEEDMKMANVTIKVPVDMFDRTLMRVKQLAVKVESERESMSDVTDRLVDLEARLVNLEAQEEQYLEIMEEAKTIEEILKVGDYLSRARYEIERVSGQLKNINGQVEMSSIVVDLTAESDVEVFGVRWRPLLVVKIAMKRLVGGFMEYVELLVQVIFFLPVLLLWGGTVLAVYYGLVKLVRFVRQQMKTCCKSKKKGSKKKSKKK